MRKRKRNAKVYCAYLYRIEQQFKLDIDAEYLRDRFATLFNDLKKRSKGYRSPNTIRLMRSALRKYGSFLKGIKYSQQTSFPSADNSKIKPVCITDWSLKDTMVGTVRDGVQLKFILKNKSYYVPANYITEDIPPIRYIALHEQGIGSEPGIRRYGEVMAVQRIKRDQIPVPMNRNNANELYCYFKVRRWIQLPQTIDIRDTHRGAPLFTNKFLLDSCTQSYQLTSVSSDDEYRLMKAVNTAFDDIRYSDYENFCAVYPINESYSLKVSHGYLAVTNDNDEILEKISVGSFSYRPRYGFDRMKKVIKA